MKPVLLLCSSVGVFFTLMTASLSAATPLGGLAVAVSPDGKTVVAGGDNRALYVVDAETLEIKDRQYTGTSMVKLGYNKAGTKLWVQDTDDEVKILDTATWKVEKKLKGANLAFAREANLAAAFDQGVINFLNLDDGSVTGSVKVAKEDRIVCLGLDAEGKRLAVLFYAKDTADEKKLAYADIPKDLQGMARDEFQQKNDGKVSDFALYEVPSGTQTARHTLFYTSTSGSVAFSGDDVIVVNYSNDNVRVAKDGTAAMFECGNSFNYGIGFPADQSLIMTGGLRDFSVETVKAGGTQAKGRISTLESWPEYFKSFEANATGSLYAGTSGYRLIKLSRAGEVEKEAAIY